MRILFASTQGAGHFNPLVPFLEAFRRAGHEVLVVGPPAPTSGRFRSAPGRIRRTSFLALLWGAMGSIPPGQGDVVVIGTIFARLNVDAMLPTMRATIEEWQPDIVLREASEFASAIAADEQDLRHVRVAIGLHAFEEAALAFASPALEDRRPGLTGRIAASDYLTCWPESLDPVAVPVQRFSDPAAQAEPDPLPNWWPGDRATAGLRHVRQRYRAVPSRGSGLRQGDRSCWPTWKLVSC